MTAIFVDQTEMKKAEKSRGLLDYSSETWFIEIPCHPPTFNIVVSTSSNLHLPVMHMQGIRNLLSDLWISSV